MKLWLVDNFSSELVLGSIYTLPCNLPIVSNFHGVPTAWLTLGRSPLSLAHYPLFLGTNGPEVWRFVLMLEISKSLAFIPLYKCCSYAKTVITGRYRLNSAPPEIHVITVPHQYWRLGPQIPR